MQNYGVVLHKANSPVCWSLGSDHQAHAHFCLGGSQTHRVQIQIWLQALMASSWWTLQLLLFKTPWGDQRVASDETLGHDRIPVPVQTHHRAWSDQLLLFRQMYYQILFWSPFDDCRAFTLHFLPSQITQDPRSAQTLHIKTDGGPYYFPNAFFTHRVAHILDLTSEMAHFLHISWLKPGELAVLGLQGGRLNFIKSFLKEHLRISFWHGGW